VVPIEALLAIETVTLAASDVPRGTLREFYTTLRGLTYSPELLQEGSPDVVRFTHQRRSIVLERERETPGYLALQVSATHFGNALVRLRDRRIAYELLHTDGGLSRALYLRDPANNWVHLLETRPF
jgi:hypothetical protein